MSLTYPSPSLWLPGQNLPERERRGFPTGLPVEHRAYEDERMLRKAGDKKTRRWMPGYPCCCDKCSICAGTLPDNYSVVFSGFVDGDCPSGCASYWDNTFVTPFLVISPTICRWTYSGTFDCGLGPPTASYVQLYWVKRGNDYCLEVMASMETGGYDVWKHNYGVDKPSCDAPSDLLLIHYLHTNWQCNGINATCHITAL